MVDTFLNYWQGLTLAYQFGFATLALIGFATLWTGWKGPEYRR